MNQTSSKPATRPIEPVTLDCDHILTQAGGDPEMLVQLCAIFLNELPIHREALKTALHEKDYLVAGRHLQQLRSCLLIFASSRMSTSLDLLDEALRTRRLRQLGREHKTVESELMLLVPQVQLLMLEISTPGTAIQ